MTTTSCSIQLEAAVEDSDLTHRSFLNLVTGEVVFFSDYLGLSDEDERLLEEIDESNDYVPLCCVCSSL